jgi:hypothetical protein
MTYHDHRADPKVRNLSRAKVEVSDPAPDFVLPVLDTSVGRGKVSDERVRLLDVARNQPVALIFGSYT